MQSFCYLKEQNNLASPCLDIYSTGQQFSSNFVDHKFGFRHLKQESDGTCVLSLFVDLAYDLLAGHVLTTCKKLRSVCQSYTIRSGIAPSPAELRLVLCLGSVTGDQLHHGLAYRLAVSSCLGTKASNSIHLSGPFLCFNTQKHNCTCLSPLVNS